MKGCTNLTV